MREIKNVREHDELLESKKPILLDFYADWCGPCRALLPVVEELSEQYKDDFEIAKINVDSNPELASQYGVRSIPSLFFIENQQVSENLLGVQTKAVLESKIQERLIVA